MNETVKIIFGLLGGGSIYIRHEHDERMPAEGSRREDEGNSCDAHQNPVLGVLAERLLQQCFKAAVLQQSW